MQPSPRDGTVRSASRWRVSSRSSVWSSSALASARNSISWLRSVSSLCRRALSTDSAARRAIAEAKSRSSCVVEAPGLRRHERHDAQRLAARPQRHQHRRAQAEPADDLEVLGIARALLDHLVGDLAGTAPPCRCAAPPALPGRRSGRSDSGPPGPTRTAPAWGRCGRPRRRSIAPPSPCMWIAHQSREPRHGDPRQPLQHDLVVERAVERGVDLDQERGPPLELLGAAAGLGLLLEQPHALALDLELVGDVADDARHPDHLAVSSRIGDSVSATSTSSPSLRWRTVRWLVIARPSISWRTR